MTAIEAEQELTKQLGAGERLLWTGTPRHGMLFRGTDVFLVPMSLLWAGFVVFWTLSVMRSGARMFFVLWGIPFVLMGVNLVFGRFIVDKALRERTAYGLTDRRVIILSGLFARSVKSLQLRTLSDVTLDERTDGRGTITFGPTHPMARWFWGAAWPGVSGYQSPAFEAIPSAREVYGRIRNAQEAKR